eukprot:scaffold255023_cov32-Tisochrysis_lutea.AAC.1
MTLPALIRACNSNDTAACAQLLAAADAKVNEKDKDGMTALMHACSAGHTSFARLLVAARAKVDVKDKDGKTALMIACSAGHAACALLLLAAGADVKAMDRWKGEALMYACNKGHVVCVELLLRHGARVNINFNSLKYATPLRMTPVNLGAQYVRCAELLLDAGACTTHIDVRRVEEYVRLGVCEEALLEKYKKAERTPDAHRQEAFSTGRNESDTEEYDDDGPPLPSESEEQMSNSDRDYDDLDERDVQLVHPIQEGEISRREYEVWA